jgi:DDE superfamily endonuclease
MRPGRVLRRDGEYQRCGTANVFCGVQPKAGWYFPKVTANRSSPEFADYLLEVTIRYPEADTIHLVLDNLSSHTRKAMVERFGENAGGWLWERFTVHYTPQARQLAEPGRDRDQPVFAAMPRPPPDRRSGFSAETNSGVEFSYEPPSRPDPMEI